MPESGLSISPLACADIQYGNYPKAQSMNEYVGATIMQNRIMKLAEVMEATGLSRSSIYRRMKNKSFPLAVSLGGKAVGWPKSEIEQWILERIAERDA